MAIARPYKNTSPVPRPYVAIVRRFADVRRGNRPSHLMPVDRPGQTYYLPVMADTRKDAHRRALTRAGRALNLPNTRYLGMIHLSEAEQLSAALKARYRPLRLPDVPPDHVWDLRNFPVTGGISVDPRLRRQHEMGICLPAEAWQWLAEQEEVRGLGPSRFVEQVLRTQYPELDERLAAIEAEAAAKGLPGSK